MPVVELWRIFEKMPCKPNKHILEALTLNALFDGKNIDDTSTLTQCHYGHFQMLVAYAILNQHNPSKHWKLSLSNCGIVLHKHDTFIVPDDEVWNFSMDRLEVLSTPHMIINYFRNSIPSNHHNIPIDSKHLMRQLRFGMYDEIFEYKNNEHNCINIPPDLDDMIISILGSYSPNMIIISRIDKYSDISISI